MARFVSPTEYIEEEVRSVANPVPLGLITLAFTTALVGASYAHFLVPAARIGLGLLVGPALFYGGIVQVLAGMWEFRKNNTLAATLFPRTAGSFSLLGHYSCPFLV